MQGSDELLLRWPLRSESPLSLHPMLPQFAHDVDAILHHHLFVLRLQGSDLGKNP